MKLIPISKALGHGRNLVSHFHHSTKSSYVLKQRDLHTDESSLTYPKNIFAVKKGEPKKVQVTERRKDVISL